MSDDRVVSLGARRPPAGRRLAATLVFPNYLLRMPMEPGATAPVWAIEPIEASFADRDEPMTVHPRFGMIDHSPDGGSGRVVEDDGVVRADLYFERELFLALQSAAFSSMPLTLFVTFGAENDAPPNVMLAIERRTA